VNRKRIGVILIVVGFLLAIAVGAIVYLQVQQAEEVAKRTPTVDVVVAQVDLPERVAVQAAAVAVTKVPEYLVPLEAATKVQDVVGKYPLTPIYKSEVVVKSKLADTAGKAGPAFVLREGMVAVTYSGSDLLSATGAIRSGDRVDMLITMPLPPPTTGGQPAPALPMVTQTYLQNLEVLQVGNFPAAGGTAASSGGKSITFQVDHQTALVLKWAKDAGAVIDLVLRHPADKEPVNTEAITMDYVFKRFNFKFAEAPR